MKAEGHWWSLLLCNRLPRDKLIRKGVLRLAEEVSHGGPTCAPVKVQRKEIPDLPWKLEMGRSNQACHQTSIKPQTVCSSAGTTVIPLQVLWAYFQFKWLYSKLNWAYFESQISWDAAFQDNTSPRTNVFLLLLSLDPITSKQFSCAILLRPLFVSHLTYPLGLCIS